MNLHKITYLTALLVLAFIGTSCSQEPQEIHYNSDECAHCRMMITDNKFAAQLVTDKGKAFKFDAIECLTAYSKANKEVADGAKYWVSDYNNPGSWLNTEEAVFIKSDVINSPMGASLLALSNKSEAEAHLQEKPGRIISWEQMLQIEMKMGSGMPQH